MWTIAAQRSPAPAPTLVAGDPPVCVRALCSQAGCAWALMRIEQRTLRSGLIAVKKGMTAAWDPHGARHALTLLQVWTHVNTVAEGPSWLPCGLVLPSPAPCERYHAERINPPAGD